MKIEKINAAVIGCGVISDIYMDSLKNRFRIINLTACSDLDEKRSRKQAEKYGIESKSTEAIMQDPNVDMIINLTTPNAHYSIIKQALTHGKHVFSEKMIAVELEQGKELLDLAREKKLRLGVAPDTFLGAGIQTAKYILEHGLIGIPTSALVSLNRNFGLYGDLLPHLLKPGGNLPFDTGCYYLTALAALLGPVEYVSGFSRIYRPERTGEHLDKPWFGEPMKAEAENILAGSMQYKSGVLCSVHFNSESIVNELPELKIYGTEGVLIIGDPNTFGSPVVLKKPMSDAVEFPFTHGYKDNSRGIGCAEMAWAMRAGRPHRASMEMAYHVFEQIHGMLISARNGCRYEMESTFDIPEALPAGYIDNGFWGPTEESALMK